MSEFSTAPAGAPSAHGGQSGPIWNNSAGLIRADLPESAWKLVVPQEVCDELASPELTAGNATLALAARIRRRLRDDTGLLVADVLPTQDWSPAQLRHSIEKLARAFHPPLPQDIKGTRFYDVRDSGVKSRPGVRRSVTREKQPFHTDGPWLKSPPHVVALHCLSAAKSGGVSSCISLQRVFEKLHRLHPTAMGTLAKALPWHRQKTHPVGEPPATFNPLWWDDNRGRHARLYTDYIQSGAASMGIELDAQTQAALRSLDLALEDSDLALRFTLKPGQSLWLNNHVCAHSRSEFVDGKIKRHYLRTWHELPEEAPG